MLMDTARKLSGELLNSPEYLEYKRAKEELSNDEYVSSLVKAYNALEMSLKMGSVFEQEPDSLNTKRFEELSSLIYETREGSAYLLAKMRLQSLVGEIFSIISGPIDFFNL
ncbi:MAG TPA: YlbF family regulator [Christensenellaceae bacterium]|nr:YlbF family regulator [Christensenellaceae bacterium]